MKKIILIAAVAIAAAACSKTIDTNPAASQKAIDFGSWSENMTKAHEGSTWENGETFKVFGSKTGAVSETVFDGQLVQYNATSTTWGYTPVKFWDITATNYTFYAFLPADELEAGTYVSNGKFVSKEVEFDAPATNADDILVANKYSRDKGATSMSTAAVALVFNHVATLVDVKVKMDASLASMGTNVTVKVDAASLQAIRSKGTFTVTGYEDGTNKPTFSGFGWAPDATPTVSAYNASATPTIASKTTYDNGVASSTTPAADAMFTDYVVMPQDLTNGQKLVMSYTITTDDGNGNSSTATYTDVEVALENFVKTDNTANTGDKIVGWYPGVHYIYYVTIGANAITFTASVSDWATEVVSGYRYLLN